MTQVIPRSPARYRKPETRRRMPSSDACKKNEKRLFETQSRSFGPLSGTLLNLGTWANSPCRKSQKLLARPCVRPKRACFVHEKPSATRQSCADFVKVNQRTTTLRFWLSVRIHRVFLNKTEVAHEDETRRSEIPRNIAVPQSRGRSTPILCGNKCYHWVRRIRSARETSDRF